MESHIFGILGVRKLWQTGWRILGTKKMGRFAVTRSPLPGASNSHVFVQRRFPKLGYFQIYKSFP